MAALLNIRNREIKLLQRCLQSVDLFRYQRGDMVGVHDARQKGGLAVSWPRSLNQNRLPVAEVIVLETLIECHRLSSFLANNLVGT